jgi:CRP/FNR family transcriptional regulator, cyclic AMP receptor protein
MLSDSSLLSNVPIFEGLDDEARGLLASQLDEVNFEAGQLVFKRGDPGGAIFIVSDGEVEIFLEDSTGQRIVFENAKAGDFFGELSLLDGDPRSASAQALKATRTLRVDRSDLKLLFSKHPDSALEVLGIIGRRLREADKLLHLTPRSSPNQAVEERLSPIMRIADAASNFAGTFSFLLVHAAWFAVWIAVNTGRLTFIEKFDEYPFGLLTMVVSLEAIFLSCMVLISQNRQAAKDKIRSDVEYEANIRAGLEVTQLHVKIDSVIERMAALEKIQKPTTPKMTSSSGSYPGIPSAPTPAPNSP